MGHSENFISKIMSIESQLETYAESGTPNEQKELLQNLLVDSEKMKREYLEGEDESFIDKIKRLFGLKAKEQELELLPMIEELIERISEENRKAGNFYR